MAMAPYCPARLRECLHIRFSHTFAMAFSLHDGPPLGAAKAC
jgi:hypothetical protein